MKALIEVNQIETFRLDLLGHGKPMSKLEQKKLKMFKMVLQGKCYDHIIWDGLKS